MKRTIKYVLLHSIILASIPSFCAQHAAFEPKATLTLVKNDTIQTLELLIEHPATKHLITLMIGPGKTIKPNVDLNMREIMEDEFVTNLITIGDPKTGKYLLDSMALYRITKSTPSPHYYVGLQAPTKSMGAALIQQHISKILPGPAPIGSRNDYKMHIILKGKNLNESEIKVTEEHRD